MRTRSPGTTIQDCGQHVGDGHDAQIYDTSAGLQTFQGCNFVGGGTGTALFKSDSGAVADHVHRYPFRQF